MGPCDFRLIELIRQNKHLYNQRDPDFRNLEKKEITWRAIAAAQGSTPDVCRRRFRSLRDRFVREKRQNKQQLLDGTVANPILLKMMFLWDHLRPHRKFTWNQPKHRRYQLDESESSGHSDQSPDPAEADMALAASQQEQRLMADIEEQNVEQHPAEDESTTEATSMQEVTEAHPTTRRYRPIRPKPDTSDQRSNPIIVNLGSKQIRNCGDREEGSDGYETLQEIGGMSVVNRGRPSESSSREHPSQNRGDDSSFSSQISSNDAFCLMLKDSLDQVINPLKLSLLRIKILTILHNEVYG